MAAKTRSKLDDYSESYDIFGNSPQFISNNKRKARPNKRRHEEQVEELLCQIRPLEERLKCLGRPPATDANTEETIIREKLQVDQKKLRDEKDLAIAKRKTMDENLRVLNNKISKMSDSLSKLEAGLKFKTQSAIDDAIKKLDYQLQTRHFKYSEENRIVREIDSLRRSKKKVKEYQERRKEYEGERDKKRTLKEERDKYFRMVSQLKTREDSKRQELTRLRSKENEAWTRYKTSGPEREALKKQIDQLYEQKRQLVADFRILQSEFIEHDKIQRAESLRKRHEEKKAFLQAKQKEWDVYEASLEPYEEERQMCSALIKYLRKFQAPGSDHMDDVSPLPSPVASTPPTSWKVDHKEFTILKKKVDDEDEVFLANSLGGKKRKSGRRSRKSSWINKPIRHSAQIFSQFTTLGLKAPTTAADLAEVMDQLQAKKQQYKEFSKSAMSASSSDTHHRRHLSGSSTISTTSSQATSEADSSLASNLTSSYNGETMDRLSGSRTPVDDNGSEGSNSPRGSFQFKSLPKLQTKLSALNISATQCLQEKKKTNNDNDTVPSQSDSNELALPAHKQDKDNTGDGSSSSTATESTLPETPLSDISAPFETVEGLDSGIDESRGGKGDEGEQLGIDETRGGKGDEEEQRKDDGKDAIIDNDSQKMSDMNANVQESTTSEEAVNNTHNAKQEILSCSIGGDGTDEVQGIHNSKESESFNIADSQCEHSSPDITL